MRCWSCDADNKDNLRACTSCGSALLGARPEQAPVAPLATPFATQSGSRRQLTVLFCDLVGSTPLSTQLDPEDLAELMFAYQRCCSDSIDAFGGFLARYMGDGILVYFGHPSAREDAAECAVRTALAIVASVSALDTRFGLRLQVRIGIATGPVVVGDLVAVGTSQEQQVVGETLNLAARLQTLAEPNEVLVAPSTRQLIGDLFDCVALGPQTLRGFARPVLAWRVLGESAVAGRFEALRPAATSLVGREPEIGVLFERWERARTGRGQVVTLSGEPGIGKSRLARALTEQLGRRDFTRWLFQCSPYHQNSALYPIADHLQRAAKFAKGDTAATKLRKIEALSRRVGNGDATLALLAHLVSVPTGKYGPVLDIDPRRQRQLILTAMVDLVAKVAEREPVLLTIEDLHWADPTTLDLFDSLASRLVELPILMLGTFRREFVCRWTGEHVTELQLNRLTREESEELINHVAGGHSVRREVLHQIAANADGVPLFLEELTRTVLESELLKEGGGASDKHALSLAIPATLRDSLLARLDRSSAGREVAQVAAAIGRVFSYEVLASVLQWPENVVSQGLALLIETGLVVPRRSSVAEYTFKHALVQEAAYDSLLRGPRAALHARIAAVLQEQAPDIAAEQPESLARHYTLAGNVDQAVRYWLAAGRRATERATGAEAVGHLRKAAEVLQTAPETPERLRRELEIHVEIVAATIAGNGYGSPETAQATAEARAIAGKLGGATELIPVLYGEWAYSIVSGEIRKAKILADQYFRLARSSAGPVQVIMGHGMLGTSLASLGKLSRACAQHDRVLSLYRPSLHAGASFKLGEDGRVAALSFLALTRLIQGDVERAVAASSEAQRYAGELGHPNTLALALCHGGVVFHQLTRKFTQMAECCARMGELAEQRGMTLWLVVREALESWLLGERGARDEAIARMLNLFGDQKARGTHPIRTYLLGLLADLHARAGDPSAGLDVIANALEIARESGEGMWEADLHRLRGDLLLAHSASRADEAERCFAGAIEIARGQRARLWELRATTSLARLLRRQGRSREIGERLASVARLFPADAGLADVEEARALLEL